MVNAKRELVSGGAMFMQFANVYIYCISWTQIERRTGEARSDYNLRKKLVA